MRVLDATQMREADRRTIEDVGVPADALMERAGAGVVAAMDATFADLARRRVAILCGRGNNGGDGFVVARLLRDRGADAAVYLFGSDVEVRGAARAQLDALRRTDADVVEVIEDDAWSRHAAAVREADIIVDALVGTGLKAPLTGRLAAVIADVNASGRPVVAIDLPSGLSAGDPTPIGPAIQASLTVTLGAPKLALVLPPGERLAGKLVIADIGIPDRVIRDLDGPRIEMLTGGRMRPAILPRAEESHKGDYGHVLVVAGSPGRTGAAALAGLAALRSGAGLVTVAAPRGCITIIAALGAEFMTLGLPEDASGGIAPEAVEALLSFGADAIAVGPGLGRSPGTRAVADALLAEAEVPLILDADAIPVFADQPGRLRGRKGAAVVITPHPGEFAALLGVPTADVQARRLQAAREFAMTHGIRVVLKGHRTIVATPGGAVFINTTGNPGMATAGAGDVLTGAVAAWAARTKQLDEACALAVFLHGLAGDLASADEGEVGVIAGDILANLGRAVLELTASRQTVASWP